MYDTEPMKPSNTGRLIADILPDTLAFNWSRTEAPLPLLTLLNSQQYQPLVVFPAAYVKNEERAVVHHLANHKPPLFIMLDGTWPEARKMFRKSPWLDAFPVISVNLERLSGYGLREAHAGYQYCTAEVAVALLEIASDLPAAQQLYAHFTLFRERYLAGKPHHQPGVTAEFQKTD